MRVFYDHQIFCEQPFGGISRYFFELIRGFSNSQQIQPVFSAKFTNNFFANELINKKDWFTKSSFKGKKDIVRLINYLLTEQQLKKQHFDIYHPTYYNSKLLQYNTNKPLVITIHDLVDEKFNNKNPRFRSLIAHRKKMIEKADAIIAISESTKNDLLNLYPISAHKVVTIYHGNALKVASHIANRKKYILYVGSREGIHKNFESFLQSAILFLQHEKEYQFICAGGKPFTENELNIIHQHNLSDKIVYHPIISDSQLITLYSEAALLVYPSLYEGFGFPIVEAFSCSCPVLTNPVSSMIEIAEDAAFYFSSDTPQDMCNNIVNAITNEAERSNKIKKGLIRAGNFTWETTVEKTGQLYQSLLS